VPPRTLLRHLRQHAPRQRHDHELRHALGVHAGRRAVHARRLERDRRQRLAGGERGELLHGAARQRAREALHQVREERREHGVLRVTGDGGGND
jgi:hypothetical protein